MPAKRAGNGGNAELLQDREAIAPANSLRDCISRPRFLARERPRTTLGPRKQGAKVALNLSAYATPHGIKRVASRQATAVFHRPSVFTRGRWPSCTLLSEFWLHVSPEDGHSGAELIDNRLEVHPRGESGTFIVCR